MPEHSQSHQAGIETPAFRLGCMGTMPPNRTKLELKQDAYQVIKNSADTPNRTKLELKLNCRFETCNPDTGSQSHQAGIETIYESD